MGHFSEQSFYEILELSPHANSEEIQKAFYKAKATYSPASTALYSVFSESEAQELLRLIDEAYAVLSNSAKRREYDKTLAKNSPSAEPSSATPIQKTPAAATEDLPDFMLPATEPVKTPSPSSPTKAKEPEPSSVPGKGYGKTIISHYNVDESFETEIANQTVFDGTFLQKVRHYKNISIDQLSETSRISRPYLISVETNDFHALPAPVYVRGFIMSVARLLGLNERLTADSYMKLFKDSRDK